MTCERRQVLLRNLLIVLCCTLPIVAASWVKSDTLHAPLPGFRISPWFGEQVEEERTLTGMRWIINAPAPNRFDPARPTLLIFYATPNGNTIEQTLGSTLPAGTDWHFDIQHIAAQTRKLREADKTENIVLVCTEAEGESWPLWRQKHADNAAQIREMVDSLHKRIPGSAVRVALTAHSGGGSFLFGFLNGGAEIPDYVTRIAFLDANYSFSEEEGHGDKLRAWLQGDPTRRLEVIAYDDRNVTLNGKPVVSATGGTYRASHRMIDSLGKDIPFTSSVQGDFERYEGIHGQCLVLIHKNPQNKILHTALVGEMNGFLQAMTQGTPEEKSWGSFGGPRAYTAWVQPAVSAPATPLPSLAVTLPARKAEAPGGAALMREIAEMPLVEREKTVEEQILGGNLPEFERTFKTLHVTTVDSKGVVHTADYEVMPDYLAVGSDADYVRIPLTPMTARRIADNFDCVLPTRKMVDDIYRNAELKLEPIPLTQEREAVHTFVEHNALIEKQRMDRPLGLLVAGIKKDVVVTNRLQERSNRVAIYGWHRLDGSPIQPLTIVHRDTYVDYSHGIRLIRRTLQVDGKPITVTEVLKDPMLCALLSDEGPIDTP